MFTGKITTAKECRNEHKQPACKVSGAVKQKGQGDWGINAQ